MIARVKRQEKTAVVVRGTGHLALGLDGSVRVVVEKIEILVFVKLMVTISGSRLYQKNLECRINGYTSSGRIFYVNIMCRAENVAPRRNKEQKNFIAIVLCIEEVRSD